MEREFVGDEQALSAYFEATYVGRPVPNGGRRPLLGSACWGVESRTHAGYLRTNNAAAAFVNAFACTVVRPDHHHVGRFAEALRLHQNMKCVAAKTVATHRPIAGRELAELEAGLRKNAEKRQGDMAAWLAATAARFEEDGDIATLMRRIARCYMCAEFKTL